MRFAGRCSQQGTRVQRIRTRVQQARRLFDLLPDVVRQRLGQPFKPCGNGAEIDRQLTGRRRATR
jgi:hypothetical protein